MVKNKKTLNTYNKTTIVFGYSLFALTVISFLISTAIPFSFTLSYPTARHFNIIVMVVAFAIATILPALASYFIGDKVTHAKNKSLHHYNGVLFGIAAYWISQSLSWIGFNSLFGISDSNSSARLVAMNVTPAIISVILMAIVAVIYTKRGTARASVMSYRPYQVILIAGVLAAFIAPYLSAGLDMSNVAANVATLGAPLVVIAIAYKVLAKYQSNRLARVCDAIIAMSMGWIATWLASSFIHLIQLPYQIALLASYMIGLAVFVVFLYLRTCKP